MGFKYWYWLIKMRTDWNREINVQPSPICLFELFTFNIVHVLNIAINVDMQIIMCTDNCFTSEIKWAPRTFHALCSGLRHIHIVWQGEISYLINTRVKLITDSYTFESVETGFLIFHVIWCSFQGEVGFVTLH